MLDTVGITRVVKCLKFIAALLSLLEACNGATVRAWGSKGMPSEPC